MYQKRPCSTVDCDMIAQRGEYCGGCKAKYNKVDKKGNREHVCGDFAIKSGITSKKGKRLQRYICRLCDNTWNLEK